VKGNVRSLAGWQQAVHASIRSDPLWEFQVYRKALFLHDLAWQDCEHLLKDARGREVARQLIRGVGAIRANIEEGYGHGYGKDYSYRLRIAMAEARESRGWYWRGRHLIPSEVLDHRLDLLSEIIAMLAPNIGRQRHYKRQK
jgi:four helix bundle protein